MKFMFQTKGLNFKSAKWKLKIDDAISKNGIIFKLRKANIEKFFLYLAEFLISTKCFYVFAEFNLINLC